MRKRAVTLMRFGRAEPALSMTLTASKKLARVSAEDVLRGITGEGFFLQMPPKEGEWA